MGLLPLWFMLGIYDVIVIYPDGSVSLETWDYETGSFTLSPAARRWESIDACDNAHIFHPAEVFLLGVIQNGRVVTLFDYEERPLTQFHSLHHATQSIAPWVAETGHFVYVP